MNLDEGVQEVNDILLGVDLAYQPELDNYQTITRAINRALRAIATEQEWSYFAGEENVATASTGMESVRFRSAIRPRITGDDAVRLVDDNGRVVVWAYYQPRDAVHKYRHLQGLWASHTNRDLVFSRPLFSGEDGLNIIVPVMREPKIFRMPVQPIDPDEPLIPIPIDVREQLIDFDYPDLVLRKAAYMVAQTNPVLQPRVQTLEQDFKNLMYALVERDTRATESPFVNDWDLGIGGSIHGDTFRSRAPHSDTGIEN